MSTNDTLRGLLELLTELGDALENLEVWGRHSDQGYRKLKDWYRKVELETKRIDAALAKPVHSAQDDYDHFLSYSGLKDNPTLRYAYFHGAGADCNKPECSKTTDKWAEYKEKFCGCKDASRLNSCKGLPTCSLHADHPERKHPATRDESHRPEELGEHAVETEWLAKLSTALRQYRHNVGEGFVFGYDVEETQRIFVEALKQAGAIK